MRVPARARWGLLLIAIVSIAGGAPAAAQTPATGFRSVAVSAERDVRDWDTAIARMTRTDELRVRRTDADPLVAGRAHERIDQYYNGVRVLGGELVRQTDHGQTVSVFGGVYAGIDLDTRPAIGAGAAADLIRDVTGAAVAPGHAPELVVLPLDGGGYALTWRARVRTGTDVLVCYLDARTGTPVLTYSDLETTVGVGKGVLDDTKKVSTSLKNGQYVTLDQMRPPSIATYNMKGNLNRTNLYLSGIVLLADNDLGTDSDNDWTDQAIVDAHAYAGWTYDYYFRRFGRKGLDGRDLAMVSLVHPVNRDDWQSQSSSVLNLYYLNAFYAGDGIMVYGEGLPSTVTAGGLRWAYFSGALDVVAHELTHGVTDYTSGLIYRNESGALNEAFSDIMGTSVEFYYQTPGDGYLKADYLLGEDLTNPRNGFRSMANPAAYGDPDHYSKRYTGTSDNGGVHTNSGIVNQAFYLAIEGGTNRTSGLSATGVGSANREKIEKVYYRAFTQMLTANATFALARAATIQAARDIYGTGSDVERAVTTAWTAVGVN
jgi:Zn-dependent metalloprotease